MIRPYNKLDYLWLAEALEDMYTEIYGDKASTDIHTYIAMIVDHLKDSRDDIWIDDEHRGFFIVRDETEAVAPTVHRYNGLRVYIGKEYRNGRVLLEFYNKLFEAYPDGDILGVTEINSEHIAVLDKRHTLIAKVYKLNRSTL